jgi:hypothetical protein
MKRTGFMVLGMHRSGTSAMAAVLHICGATVGSGMLKASGNNPKGYFESALVLEAMEQLLEACGSFWHDWRSLDLARADPAVLAALKVKILRNFERNFGNREKFAFKNPRNCRAVPFWREILAEFGAEPVAVHVLRHPLEVAESLAHRDAMPVDKALLLWLRHVLDAERETRGMRRAFVSYDDLLADWRGVVRRVFDAGGAELPADMQPAEQRVGQFLDSSLQHNRIGPDQSAPVLADVPLAAQAWEVLKGYAAGAGAGAGEEARLDTIFEDFRQACRPFQSYFAATEMQLMRIEKAVARAADQLARVMQ